MRLMFSPSIRRQVAKHPQLLPPSRCRDMHDQPLPFIARGIAWLIWLDKLLDKDIPALRAPCAEHVPKAIFTSNATDSLEQQEF